VVAESAADVVQAVRFARSRGMRIAPQGTGHGSEPLEPLEGAMLLRTVRMRGVRIDPAARTARAEAGALWQDVTVPAAEHGPGRARGQLTERGRDRLYPRRGHGLAGPPLRAGRQQRHTAADIVTPGRAVFGAPTPATSRTCCGRSRAAAAASGWLTALEMRLYPVRELYAGALFFPIQRAAEVLHAWRGWTGTVPDEVTSLGRILRVPPLPEVPERLRGRAFALVEAAYLGGAAAGAALIRPLHRLGPDLDTFAMIPAPALQQLHMDPDQPVPGQGDGAFLAGFPAAAIDALITVAGPDA